MTHRFIRCESLERRALLAVDLTVASDLIMDSTIFADVYQDDDLFAGRIPMNIKVTNLGATTAAGAIEVAVILSKDKHISPANDSITRISDWANMAGGDGQSSFLTPYVEMGIEPGYYHVGLHVDPDNAFAEADENNNVFWSAKPRIYVVTEAWPSGSITGTDGNDVILIDDYLSDTFVTVNGVTKAMDPYGAYKTRDKGIFIDAGPGRDKVVAVNPFLETRLQVTGNTGNDTLVGGAGDDELSGSYGYDRVLGGAGDDFLLGGAVNDYLNGEAGNDLMIGGGGNDRLVDFVGRDHFIAGPGNDVLLTRDTRSTVHNNPDTLSGGTGHDRAQVDVTPSADNLVSIDELLA